MLVRVFVSLAVSLVIATAQPAESTVAPTVRSPIELALPDDSVPDDTANPFLPEDRPIGDCISAVPKPGCGSEARGGWHQYLVAIVMVAGLAIIGWRIVVGVRPRTRRVAGRER